ncbi:MAG: Rpp14/Pop5 family protein [Promethearchaeota archaeon]
MNKKERARYILFKIVRGEKSDFSQKDFLKAIWQSIWRYFGMKIANKIGLWLVEFNLVDNFGIIRCSHETKEILISALTLIKDINKNNIIISPIKTSGTIKSIKKIKKIVLK